MGREDLEIRLGAEMGGEGPVAVGLETVVVVVAMEGVVEGLRDAYRAAVAAAPTAALPAATKPSVNLDMVIPFKPRQKAAWDEGRGTEGVFPLL